jgi:hypothetical protein
MDPPFNPIRMLEELYTACYALPAPRLIEPLPAEYVISCGREALWIRAFTDGTVLVWVEDDPQ